MFLTVHRLVLMCVTAALVFATALSFPRADALPLVHLPFAVKVMTQNDNGIGNMTFSDMAKLVTFISASGAPAGAYDRARAAGMKTVWYIDPHRIGDVPGAMSDRPAITALNTGSDLMRCAGGGALNSTYSERNGTFFGDPTSAHLVAQTNAHVAAAAAHYGKIDYVWKDDSMLLTDQWADTWFCGDPSPALNANRGNGMPAIGHGSPSGAHITYADRTPYTSQRFLADLVKFDDRMSAPTMDEGACNGDGSDMGRDGDDGGATATLVANAHNAAAAMCENFAIGWGNNQTVNGKAVDRYWKQDLNSGIEVISARKMFVSYEYIGNQGGTHRGVPVDVDQRGYIYASFMLLFDWNYSVYKTGAWGATLKTAAPVLVLPENLLVPLEPLQTAHWPQRIGQLEKNGVYVREFKTCAYAGTPIGPCAALVNPSSNAPAPLPALQQTYGHRIAFTGNNGAFTGRHGTPNYGDTGDVAFASAGVPATIPPAGWAILVR